MRPLRLSTGHSALHQHAYQPALSTRDALPKIIIGNTVLSVPSSFLFVLFSPLFFPPSSVSFLLLSVPLITGFPFPFPPHPPYFSSLLLAVSPANPDSYGVWESIVSYISFSYFIFCFKQFSSFWFMCSTDSTVRLSISFQVKFNIASYPIVYIFLRLWTPLEDPPPKPSCEFALRVRYDRTRFAK